MSDLIAFLTARLDEDEAAARATSRPAWREWYAEPWYDGEFLNDGRTVRADLHGRAGAGGFTSQGALPAVMADHITRHDPARALAEVGAKRAILAAHRITDGRCHVCTAIAGGHATRFRAPCPTLYFLAAIYSDHPDYREATAE